MASGRAGTGRSESKSNSAEISSALRLIKGNGIEYVDLQFPDIFGRLQRTTIPAEHFDEDAFHDGFAKLDGSSVAGFTEIFESDMMLFPIAKSARRLPWSPNTVRMLAEVHRGYGKGRFERDPRWIGEKAEEHQKGMGLNSYYGPEPEFFIFDSVDMDVAQPDAGIGYRVHAREAPWERTGSYIVRHKGGYFPAEPIDHMGALRKQMTSVLKNDFGFKIEAVHHEVSTAGQSEINFRYSTLVETADNLTTLKYVVRNVAHANGMLATFMPKPLYGDNGSGLHVHLSLWDKMKNLMYDKDAEYAELSQYGRYAVGGVLKHARALSAIVSPTVNSYHRLIPGFEAPVYIAWSASNRSAVVRIPTYAKAGVPAAKRLEYRAPDPSCNPHVAFSAILMAALDGVKKKIDPGNPVVNENIYHMSPERRRSLGIRELPRSLDEALDELESDKEFLKPVVGPEFLDTYMELKRQECRMIAQHPHPIEFLHYMDA